MTNTTVKKTKREKIIESMSFLKGLRTDMVNKDYQEYIDLALEALNYQRMLYGSGCDDVAKYYED
jgi:hypothetical protein